MEDLSLFKSYSVYDEDVVVSLLTREDYLNASNNLKCIDGVQMECQTGNYLADFSIKNGSEYLLDKAENGIYIINNGLISTTSSLEVLNVRPVLEISKNAKIVGGTGTSENPYIIRMV